ncbi:MAG: M56 family metallopeptidase [candidate division Zixibacteria bacterium]|jgi:beta-lactamase regulating signal transducer with metallopeptidase domain|nr:M56 family metallopeptidase [candidate division Zixibacteria bacterium]
MEAVYLSITEMSVVWLQAIVDSLAPSIALAALTGLLFRYTELFNARARYIICWVVLATIVLLPAAMVGWDAVQERAAGRSRNAVFSRDAGTLDESVFPATTPRLADARLSDDQLQVTTDEQVSIHRDGLTTSPSVAAESGRAERSWVDIVYGLLPVGIVVFWMTVAAALLVRLGAAYYRVRVILARSLPAEDGLHSRLERWCRLTGCRRNVTVRISDALSTPAATGFGRGTILLPESLVAQLSAEELDSILLHELAHLHRRDDWARLAEQLVVAAVLFHPAVFWLVKQLDLYRELACDDVVVNRLRTPTAYARTLAKLAAIERGGGRLALSSGAVLTKKHIFTRFSMLLNKNRTVTTGLPRVALTLVIFAIMAGGVLLMQAPSVVAIPRATISYDDLIEHFTPAWAADEQVGEWTPVAEHGWDERQYAAVEGDPQPEPPRPPAAPGAASVNSVPVVPSVPDVPGAPSARASYSRRSGGGFESLFGSLSRGISSITDEDGVTRIVVSDDNHRLTIEYAGEIEFTDDDRGVKRMSKDAYLEIEERRGRERQRLVVEPTSDGLDYLYYENGRSADYDDGARQWAGDILIEAVRSSGIGAEARVKRIRSEKGVSGVIDEIKMIEPDYVQRLYVEALLESGPLTEAETATLIETLSRGMESDYEKAELLISLAAYGQTGAGLSRAYADAIATIESDYETRRVLSATLLRDDVDPEVVSDLLLIASRMDSDYEKAELLIEMSPLVTTDSEHLRTYLLAVRDIDSDFEQRRVLSEMGLRREVEPELAEIILGVAAEMDSDYEKAELLIAMASSAGSDDRLTEMYIAAADNISSDYERRRVLSELTLDDRTPEVIYEMALRSMARMSSDYDKAEYLMSIADACARDADLRLRYVDALRSISSDYDKKRALELVLEEGKSDSAFLRATLQALREIGSDYERAQILDELASAVAQQKDLEEEYIQLIEEMSEYERDRLYRSYYRSRRD